VVTGMENFSLNTAKSFLGKNVNLHLNVTGKAKLVEYVAFGNRKSALVPLRNIAWAELLNLDLFQTAG
jgi:hypothetical protein